MNKREQSALDREMKRHEDKISQLANKRLKRLCDWFSKSFPGHHLEILFGNGAEYIKVDGMPLEDHGYPVINGRSVKCLSPVLEAIEDIDEITSGYRAACPDHIDVKTHRRKIAAKA